MNLLVKTVLFVALLGAVGGTTGAVFGLTTTWAARRAKRAAGRWRAGWAMRRSEQIRAATAAAWDQLDHDASSPTGGPR